MRLAGVTWWRGNYGSVLQAYALARTLNSFEGVSYEVLDQFGSVRSPRGVLERARGKRPSQIAKKLRWNYLMPELKQRRAALDSFIERHVPVSKASYGASSLHEANDAYDGFMCGSDQIWNPTLQPMGDLYWLGFVSDSKLKVAYAPSVGVSSFTPDQERFVAQHATRLDALSCREDEGSRLLQTTCGKPCTHVADPTLLLTADEWLELARKEAHGRPTDAPYAFVYLLRSTEAARRAVESYCREAGLKIVCFPYLDPEHAVSYDKAFGDRRIFDAGPADFISLVAGASCVFCDSYHASVFSTLMHRDVYLFPKVAEQHSNRIEDLFHTLGILSRNVDENRLNTCIRTCEPIDWQHVDKLTREFRTHSIDFLHHALGAQ